MTPCPTCSRYVRAADAACPFCGRSRAQPLVRALNTVGGAVTAMVLAACYGSPYKPDDTGLDTAPDATDVDGDTYSPPTDCDDADANVNPAATEVCDDTVDNDCDGKTDAADEDCAAAK